MSYSSSRTLGSKLNYLVSRVKREKVSIATEVSWFLMLLLHNVLKRKVFRTDVLMEQTEYGRNDRTRPVDNDNSLLLYLPVSPILLLSSSPLVPNSGTSVTKVCLEERHVVRNGR